MAKREGRRVLITFLTDNQLSDFRLRIERGEKLTPGQRAWFFKILEQIERLPRLGRPRRNNRLAAEFEKLAASGRFERRSTLIRNMAMRRITARHRGLAGLLNPKASRRQEHDEVRRECGRIKQALQRIYRNHWPEIVAPKSVA